VNVDLEEQVRECSRRIKAALRERGRSQRSVEVQLGWPRGALSRLLGAGRPELKLRQLFAVLAAIDLPPDRLFAAAPDSGTPVAGSGKAPTPTLGGFDPAELRRLIRATVDEELQRHGVDPSQRPGREALFEGNEVEFDEGDRG
jgi:transcriptional regulator with XRE-family HTH domain